MPSDGFAVSPGSTITPCPSIWSISSPSIVTEPLLITLMPTAPFPIRWTFPPMMVTPPLLICVVLFTTLNRFLRKQGCASGASIRLACGACRYETPAFPFYHWVVIRNSPNSIRLRRTGAPVIRGLACLIACVLVLSGNGHGSSSELTPLQFVAKVLLVCREVNFSQLFHHKGIDHTSGFISPLSRFSALVFNQSVDAGYKDCSVQQGAAPASVVAPRCAKKLDRTYPPGSLPRANSHASSPQEPRRYRSVWGEGRPGGWERLELTVQLLSRDVDPGKPDQKAGRESRLARLSSRRGHESEGKWSRPGSAEVIPKTARNSGGSARRAKRPHRKHFFYPGAAAPAAQAPLVSHKNCPNPDGSASPAASVAERSVDRQ